MAKNKVGIFADDLTGALDASARFAARGMATFVSVSTQVPIGASELYQVVALNMDSRHHEPRRARELAIRASSSLNSAGFPPLFNKVDSTLRGHPGLEANAVLGTLNGEMILCAPAFPATGRTVIDGHLLVNGIPVDQTDVGRDILNPVPASSVVEILRENTGMDVASVGLTEVRNGPEPLADLISRMADRGEAIAVLDSESDQDLWNIVVAASRSNKQIVLTGSGGLAASLANAYGDDGFSEREREQLAKQPYLVVAGSQREIVRAQAETVRKQAKANVIEVDGDRLLNAIEGAAERERVIGEASRSVRQGRSVVLALVSRTIGPEGGRAALLSVARDRLVAELGAITARVAPVGVNAIVLIGGDTTQGVLKALNATGIVLRDEVLPGVPAGVMHAGALDGAPVVTKAGDFGDEETLLKIFEYLATGRIWRKA
ncbi:MAG: four-carbon acid sugar kinase family protein [Chloroflexi bacterium]|nr:four-carbon acid sugar kinase family protein [Chloroflexota bacterium]